MPSTATIRVDGTRYPLQTDSEVYQSGEGYERILIVSGWHDTDERKMAQIHIRVDRVPGRSFAHASVWAGDAGWQILETIPQEWFWKDMPGYLRWANDTSDQQTQKLAADLIHNLIVLSQRVTI